MPPYNIVVFAGDYCGPEVEKPPPTPPTEQEKTKKHRLTNKQTLQVTAEALKVGLSPNTYNIQTNSSRL